MGRTFIRQDIQIGPTLNTDVGYLDDISPSAANYQTNATDLANDLNCIRSQLQNFNNRNGAGFPAGKWYDDILAPSTFENGAKRGITTLNQDLHDLQRKRILVAVTNLSDITVPAEAYAQGVLSGTVDYSDGNTVTIGATVYTMKSPFVDAAFNVKCGVSLADTLANLKAAINLEAGAGTKYGTATTLHPTVISTAAGPTSLSARAKTKGTAGNLIASVSSVADPAWGAAKLAGGAGDVTVLALGAIPTWTLGNIAAVGSVSTRGTVAAYNANFGVNDPAGIVSGDNALDPKNLCSIVDNISHDQILSSGREVYALFQVENPADADTMTGSTPHRAQLAFVRINALSTGFEAVPTADIQGKVVHYASVGRKALEDLNEQDFLRGAVIDVTGPATVDRQIVYDNQGVTPVELSTNAVLDLNSAGIYWEIRDLANAVMFKVIEGTTGSNSTVLLAPDTDVFDSSAQVNDFDKGIQARTGGVEIDIGMTAIASTGTIETTGSNDLRLFGARELYLDDLHQAGSSWAQTNGIKLSDSTAEWTNFETAFGGEVSLLKGITDAYTKQKRSRVQATLVADANANTNVNGPIGSSKTDVNLLPYNAVPNNFVTDVEVYLNGELLRNAPAAGSEDVYPGSLDTQGDLKFTFKLKGTGSKPDQLTVIVNGQ